jgi:hypothetical protein
MKCLCGYERLQDYMTDDGKEVGDEEFIRVDCFGKPFETDSEKEGCCYGEEKYRKAYLYSCPKCGTVKMGYYY